MKKIEIKLTDVKKHKPASKKLKKAGKAINIMLSVAGVCYSLYLLKPKFDKIEGIDTESLVNAQTKA